MKKNILFLLVVFVVISVCACAKHTATDTEGESITTGGISEPMSVDEKEPTGTLIPDESDVVSDPLIPSNLVSGHIIKLPDNLFESGDPIAQIGEWIYYADSEDMLLGRVHLDGSDRLRYENSSMRSPLISEDCIYYIDINDENHLYVMQHDGTGVELICEDKVCGLDDLTNDGRIYYHVADDPVEKYDPDNGETYIDWGEEKYYSIKTNGTDKQERAVGASPEADGWIYMFVDEYSDRRIYKMHPDGSEKTILTELEVDNFKIHDGWVYYDTRKGEDGLFRVSADGAVTEKLCNDNVSIDSMTFDNTHIYYIRNGYYPYVDDHYEDWLGELYTIRYDGTDRRKLCEQPADGIFLWGTRLLVVNDTVFFQAKDSSALYAIKTDGTDEQLISKNADAILKTDSGFFYEESNGTIYFYSFKKAIS